MHGKKMQPYLYLIPVIIVFSVLVAYPMFTVVRYSLLDNVIVTPTSNFVGIGHYRAILGSAKFWKAMGNSVYFSIVSLIFHLALGMTFALLLNSELVNKRFRGFCRALYILPWTFTVSIVAILWRLMLNNSGIVNELFNLTVDWFGSRDTAVHAVIFVNVWCSYPFYMISILAGLQGVSKSFYEAAKIDGASGIQCFRHITLPQLKPVLISLTLLDFIWSMQQLSLTWITTGGGPAGASATLGTFTYELAFKAYKFSRASASAVIIMVVCLVVAVFYVKQQAERD
ncbi:MAG: sugar ABC transporter permease [Clostridia bacterium]